jgi:drug/metabolite transporter (DMT)-like permease
MSWVNIAILSAAIMAMVNILDSHLLSRRMPGLRAYLFPVGSIHVIYASILCILFPLPQGADIGPILAAVASGVLRSIAALIMLDSLRKEEVSRVIPVVYSYPIFVAIMAAPLLGELLSGLEWLAVVMVVVGAVLSSMTERPSRSMRRPGQLLVLFGASILFAVADVAGKYALASISFWNMFWISAFCMSGIFLLLSLRPRFIRQVAGMQGRSTAIGLILLTETLTLIGIVLSFWALEQGPVSLVSTIVSSRPLFVLIGALILSRVWRSFLDWRYGRSSLILRLIGTVMIVAGIAIIHLL